MAAILFDLDDTLYARQDPFARAFLKTFGDRFDFGSLDMTSIYTAFVRYGLDLFNASMSGEVSMETMYIDRIRKTMLFTGYAITDGEALRFQAQYAEEQTDLRLSPTMCRVLDECAAKASFTGIVSNGDSAHQRRKFKTLGLSKWFSPDRFLPTGDLGINKPDPAVLLEAQKRWGLRSEDTWYAGDSLKNDIACAAGIGWHTLWLNRYHEPASPLPERTAASEEELLANIKNILEDRL